MIAYLNKMPGNKWMLTIVGKPCNGLELANGEHVSVSGKREANKICKDRGLKPWNF